MSWLLFALSLFYAIQADGLPASPHHDSQMDKALLLFVGGCIVSAIDKAKESFDKIQYKL